MAVSLRLVFSAANDKRVSMSFNYANTDASTNSIKTLMDRIIANSDIFEVEPLEGLGAEFVIREIRPVDIS